MFNYILFNSLFYFSCFSLLQQISYAAKMLAAKMSTVKMLMEKILDTWKGMCILSEFDLNPPANAGGARDGV